jgi:hypothetical protein
VATPGRKLSSSGPALGGLLKKPDRQLAGVVLIGEDAIRSEPVPVFQQAPRLGGRTACTRPDHFLSQAN